MTTIAAIDIGSNSLKMIIAELDDRHQIVSRRRYYRTTRLALALDAENQLPPAAIDRLAADIAAMAAIARRHRATIIEAVATAALRTAANRQLVIRRVAETAGITAEIIGGDEEGGLTAVSIGRRFLCRHSCNRLLVFNVGGGSTELNLLDGRAEIIAGRSFDWGAASLTSRFLGRSADQPVSGRQLSRISRMVGCDLRPLLSAWLPARLPRPPLIGSGGTLSVLCHLFGPPADTGPPAGDCFNLWPANTIRRVGRAVAGCDAGRRTSLYAIPADRADIIVAGLSIIMTMVRLTGVQSLYYTDLGLADGLIERIIQKQRAT
ncbi:MAG: hypothetical protein N3A57_03490 [Negativicutes bacterium]|nr:hypothetical protein [Negativicutes bacterium]